MGFSHWRRWWIFQAVTELSCRKHHLALACLLACLLAWYRLAWAFCTLGIKNNRLNGARVVGHRYGLAAQLHRTRAMNYIHVFSKVCHALSHCVGPLEQGNKILSLYHGPCAAA